MAHPDDILDFWFADALASPAAARARNAFWFGTDPAADRLIWEEFGDTVGDAAGGVYDAWADTPRGRLALILLLDQFPRNIFRGTVEAYRYDPLALGLAREGVAVGQLAGLGVPEQAFFLMPYQHAEDLADQREGVELIEDVVTGAAPEWRDVAANFADFARRHRDIVADFGRFPHRNRVLGRRSTPAETRYLDGGGETFGQAARAVSGRGRAGR